MMPESPIPIVIGVTGHRDLRAEELDTIRELVAGQLGQLKQDYPHSSFWMLNSLAAGADLLCAQIALEQGIPLLCPLPMNAEEYAADFQGRDREEFYHLLAQSQSFLCPHQEPEQPGKDYLYRQASLYVASHCHILLALWDGDEEKKDGCGTAAAVHCARNSWKEPDSDAPRVSVLQIQVNRAGSDTRLSLCARWLDEGLNAALLTQTDRFNAAAKTVDIPSGCLETPPLQRLDCLHKAADRLALSCQKKFNRGLLTGAVCCVTLVLFYLMYDELDSRGFLILYGAVMAVYGAVYALVRKLRLQEGYLQYRLLAETARVQSWLSALGVRKNAAAWFTWTQKQDALWIQFAISAALIGPQMPRSLSDEEARSAWIQGQCQYHRRALEKTRRKHRMNQRLCGAALFCMISAFLLTFILEYGFPEFMTGRMFLNLTPQSWMKIVWGVLSAVTLFAADYFGKLSLDRKMIDHQKMAELYHQVDKCFEEFPEKRSALFRRLAVEEVIETGNWYSYCQDNSLSFDL